MTAYMCYFNFAEEINEIVCTSKKSHVQFGKSFKKNVLTIEKKPFRTI